MAVQDLDTIPLVVLLGVDPAFNEPWFSTASAAEYEVVAADSATDLQTTLANRPGLLLVDGDFPFGLPPADSVVVAVLIGDHPDSPWYQVAWDRSARATPAEEATSLLRAGVEESRERLAERAMIADFHRRRATLTDKEDAVLVAVCNGRLNKQIARDLNVSVRTIEQRRRRIFEKMGVESAVPLAKFAAVVATLEDKQQRVRRRTDPADSGAPRITRNLKIAPRIIAPGLDLTAMPTSYI